MMKKLLCILLAIICITSFFACTHENSDQTDKPAETTPPSAYEQLNDEEKLLYEALIIWTTNHHDGRVLAVGSMTLDSKKVAVQLQYSIGDEIVSHPYYIGLSKSYLKTEEHQGVLTGYSEWSRVYHNEYINVDCGNINRALKEYWDTYYEDMGLN